MRRTVPEHRLKRIRRFAAKNPAGTVLPCVVHDMTRREDGSARFSEITVKVRILGFVLSRALVRIRRLDTREELKVDIGWFQEAMRN